MDDEDTASKSTVTPKPKKSTMLVVKPKKKNPYSKAGVKGKNNVAKAKVNLTKQRLPTANAPSAPPEEKLIAKIAKTRSGSDAPPPSPSKELPNKDWCAQHADMLSFSEFGGAYFTKSYVGKRDSTNYPTHCSDCKGRFVAGRIPPEPDTIKVTASKPTHGCRNCIDDDSPCLHIFCHACYNTRLLTAQACNEQTTHRKIVHVQGKPGFGEKYDEDGQIVPSN